MEFIAETLPPTKCQQMNKDIFQTYLRYTIAMFQIKTLLRSNFMALLYEVNAIIFNIENNTFLLDIILPSSSKKKNFIHEFTILHLRSVKLIIIICIHNLST